MININYVGWTMGNEDKVMILVSLPEKPLNPDMLFENTTLMLYGRRTGKLRAKLISSYDQMLMFGNHRINNGYGQYCINNRKLKHLLPQIEKHYTWAVLSQ
jgi:hypothetical protein